MTHDKLEVWFSIYSTGAEDITVAQINDFSA